MRVSRSPFRRRMTIATMVLAGTAILSGQGIAAAAGTLIPAAGILPPKHPARSLPPRPDFRKAPACARHSTADKATCNTAVLKATAHARSVLERMAGMRFSLPAYEKLTPAEQLFVTVNIERTARGLPHVTELTRHLDRIAADANKGFPGDPTFPLNVTQPGGWRAVAVGGNSAIGWENPLAANYAWMYDDGLGSGNTDCTRKHKSGCWGHRSNILATYGGPEFCPPKHPPAIIMGAAQGKFTFDLRTENVEDELIVGICGPTPKGPILTWARAKRLLHIKG